MNHSENTPRMLENHSLKQYNTFGVEVNARYFATLCDDYSLNMSLEWLQNHTAAPLILGGGSNLLFTDNYAGLALHVAFQGKRLIEETSDHYLVEAKAGENWHHFVQWCINQGYAGAENLSLIPGTVGAAPVQNIGAYGVELKDIFHSLTAYSLSSGDEKNFSLTDCQFAYRHSVFKTQQAHDYLIESVTFKFAKEPTWNLHYKGITDAIGDNPVTARSISDAIIKIRQSKLPNPDVIGNAGSFFKNPILPMQQWQLLKQSFPDIPGYPQGETVKTSAAWLIDQCQWKGKRNRDAGVYKEHALVLVNHGHASGKELWQLAQDIIASVEDKFSITLEPEPKIL